MPNTQAIRKTFKEKREKLPTQQRNAAAQQALNIWRKQSELTSAERIGLFWSVKGELPTQALIEYCLSAKQAVYLPKVDENKQGHLLFGPYQRDTPMQPDRFGIPTPQFAPSEAENPSKLDVIVMPLVAADLQGNRIGMGAGYYDRTLANLAPCKPKAHPILLGWGYEWQVLQDLLKPTEWDIPLSGLITDEHIRWF